MKLSRTTLVLFSVISILMLAVGGIVQAQATTLTITWWGSQARHDRTIAAIELYETNNPDVNIEYEFSGWGDYWTRVNTQAAGGNVACVMQQDYAFLTEWASRGLLLPLDELYASGAIDVSSVSQGILDSGMVDGQAFGLSLGTNSQVFILDADAFEAAGLELPAWDWTWDDFESISLAIHEASGIWGIAYGPWDDNSLKSLLISDGQWLFTEDGSAIGIEDPTVMVEHLERIKRLMDSGAIPSMEEQADIAAAGLEGSPIVTGGEAMRYQWSNQIVALYAAAGEGRNFILHPMPRVVEGVTPNYLKPSMFFAITEGCANVEEAAKFIDFVTNSVEANDLLLGERGVPVSTIISEDLKAKVDPVSQQVFDYIAAIGEIAQPVPPPDPAGWNDIRVNVLAPLFTDPVLFGMISAQEGFDTFVTESNNILADAASTSE